MTVRQAALCVPAALAVGFLAGSPVLGQMAPSGRDAAAEALAALHVPQADFRREWVEIGAYTVLAAPPEHSGSQVHAVYTERRNVDAFLRTGKFPDGTVLVKEVFAAATESLTTGTVSYAGDLMGRFVMVKESSNRFAGVSPLWGDGWGWAFYKGTETAKPETTDYRKDCLGCHEPARSQDLVYIQGYPALRR